MTTPSKRYLTYDNMLSIAAAMKETYTNQDAFASIAVGNDTVAAGSASDSFELAAGTNVSLSVSGSAITIAATDTTYADVVADATGAADSGLMTSDDKAKLDGIAAGAEVNQYAFSNVTVGADTIEADGKTDTLTLAAGSNVTLTANTDTDTVTIAAADTTYTLEQDENDGHVLTFTPSVGQAVEITIPDSDTTYSAAQASVSGVGGSDGLITAADQEKLDGIATGAQVNVLEGVQVNGTDLTIDGNKKVNVTVATGTTGTGTLKVNGTDVAVYGLGTAAAATVATNGVSDGETGLVTGDAVYDYVAGVVSSAYKAAGSLAPSGVVAGLLVAANEGKVYNLSADMTLDSTTAALFVDGAANDVIEGGTNIVIVDAGSSTYKFDKLAGFVDLSPYQVAADLGGLETSEVEAIIAAL